LASELAQPPFFSISVVSQTVTVEEGHKINGVTSEVQTATHTHTRTQTHTHAHTHTHTRTHTHTHTHSHTHSSSSIAVCAFPYILAFTIDSIEIRLVVNGNLVYTAVVPELQLTASRVGICYHDNHPPHTHTRGAMSSAGLW